MLCAAESDTLGTEMTGLLGVAGGVGVGTDESLGVFGCEVHDSTEVAVELGLNGGHLAVVDISGRTVERNPVAFLVGLAAHFNGAGLVIDFDFTGTGNAALTHTAGNHSSVAGHTAAHGKDTLGDSHTTEVFG